jgi:hypothetical protein
VDTSFPQKAGCVDGTSIIAIRSSFLPYANRYKSKTRLRLAVSPIPVDRKPQRSAGIDLMHAVIARAYSDYFLLRDGFVGNCAPHALRRGRS